MATLNNMRLTTWYQPSFINSFYAKGDTFQQDETFF